jgi:carboxyl-terminal processing protease
MINKKLIFIIALLALAFATLGTRDLQIVDAQNRDYYSKIKDNQYLFGRIYEEVAKRYVEEVDPEKFIRAGIEGMLSELDPYTVYFENDENDELEIMSKGNYGGLGMRIIKREGFPTIVEPPVPDTPAERAGIREGDQIIKIGDESTRDLTVSETAKRLRGNPGSKVSLTIQRAGEPEPIEFHLIRAVIEVTDITYKGLIGDRIGYIQLSHFSKRAGEEVRRAIEELKIAGMQKLILDLRSNPGGLLEAAATVADNFLKPGEPIVATKGRTSDSNQEYSARTTPIWGDEPLVILVDEASASASEIVSGAIQDLDRGIIIGTPTFGKGLVQTVVQIGKDVDLKMTTAKYYIPSGRLIQKENVFHQNEKNIFSEETDSLVFSATDSVKQPPEAFKTKNGRIVYGGGGIKPDVIVENERYNRFLTALERKSMFFGFAVEYAGKHSELKPGFEVTPEMLAGFKKYLSDKAFDYKPAGIAELEKLQASLKKEGKYAEVAPLVTQLTEGLNSGKAKDFDENVAFIKIRLKAEVSAKIGGMKAKVEALLADDPVVRKGVEILSATDRYQALLSGETKKSD